MLSRARSALEALAIAFVIAGVALLVLPARLPKGAGAAATAPVAASDSVAAGDPSLGRTIIAANIFSPARKPPASRYVGAGDDPVGAMVADAGTVMPADTAAAPVAEQVPHLYGIIAGPGGTMALLRLETVVPEPRLYKEGDRAGGYRVVRISGRAVTLAGPSGPVTLRLTTPEEDAR